MSSIKELARTTVAAGDVPENVKQQTNHIVEADEDGKVTSERDEQVTAKSAWRAVDLATREVMWINADDSMLILRAPDDADTLPTHAVVKKGLDRGAPYHKGGPWMLNLDRILGG